MMEMRDARVDELVRKLEALPTIRWIDGAQLKIDTGDLQYVLKGRRVYYEATYKRWGESFPIQQVQTPETWRLVSYLADAQLALDADVNARYQEGRVS